MGNMKFESKDDQYRLNFALYYRKLKWLRKVLTIDRENQGVDESGLQVVVLPPIYICRGLCTQNRTIHYYVWHEAGGGHKATTKMKKDSKSKVQFLRKNAKSDTALTGIQWLRHLAGKENIR